MKTTVPALAQHAIDRTPLRSVWLAIATATIVLANTMTTYAEEPPVQKPVPPGINDNFVDPNLDVSEWVARFEIESREVYAGREQVLKACAIDSGMRVADVGAGTGFYSRLFAHAVGPEGWVYAVDISPKFLQHISEQVAAEKVDNLTTVLGGMQSIRLPPESVDVVFICDTYHHFEHPQATLASIHRALKPGGSLVMIDFERIPGVSREFILGHVRAGKAEFRNEVVSAGFQYIDEIPIDAFEENYLLRFRKPSTPPQDGAPTAPPSGTTPPAGS